jgi:hypothetical protein
LQKYRYSKPCILAVACVFAACSQIATAIEIVVNKTVSAADCFTADIRASFIDMQKIFWSNNRQIKAFTLADNNPLHKNFVKNSLDMFPNQIRRVWDRMASCGTGAAPIELDSGQEMTENSLQLSFKF